MTRALGDLAPVGNTGASLTKGELVGIHWLAGRTLVPVEGVVRVLVEATGEGVEVRPRGAMGYAIQYRVGGVTVLAEGQGSQAAAMGCHIEIPGGACEALGYGRLLDIARQLQLRASRLDLAVDGCPFTPAQVWAVWEQDQVRSKVKRPADAVEGREWRSGEWIRSASGDTAYLGSRQAARRVRVYDRRETGTRLELQARHHAAAAIQADLMATSLADAPARILGHVRAFVDFTQGTDTCSSRRPLAAWWSAFCGHVLASKLRLTRVVEDGFERVDHWIRGAVAPIWAAWAVAVGPRAVHEVIADGRLRWHRRHRQVAFRLGVMG